MLSRLRITQRLSLLLMLPLAAVVLISVPFTVERVDDARAAAAIVNSSQNAREIGSVVQELQQERLLMLAYLVSPRVSRAAVVAQAQSTVDAADQARRAVTGTTTESLTTALTELDSLQGLRARVIRRTITVTEVYGTYHDAVLKLVNVMRLNDQPGADATGLRQMGSLDALMRTNEEANQVGAALVIAAVDTAAARSLASAAAPLEQVYLEHFRQEGDQQHVELLTLGADGPSAKRTAALVAGLTRASGEVAEIPIEAGLSVAQSGINIRRGLQDRIARDIATGASRRAVTAEIVAVTVATFAAGLLMMVVWLGVAVSRSVARPLRRVTLAATAVADLASREMVRVTDIESVDERPPRLAALTMRSADEIGELASAFNRVQATAALLMEQQVTTRRNVSVMFANIAHRTQSLVARQLAHIDELERNEHDEQRLASMYRLDHLTTRLRRSADSLLVIAGAREEARLSTPTPLADVIRSATAEVEGYQNVRLGAVSDVTIIAAAVPDLTLLLAELLENATAFSPPEVPVEVTASLHTGCLVQIVDRGIGMSAERLAEENARLVSRERLDVAPTTMLGLFVVGRLARRHDVTVRLLPTPVTGVTAEVVLPVGLLMWGAGTGPLGASAGDRRAAIASAPASTPGSMPGPRPSPNANPAFPTQLASVTARGADFGWFDTYGQAPAAPLQTANGSREEPGDPSRGGLRRRQPGQNLPDLDLPRGAQATTTAPAVRDPEAERAGLDAFAQGTARASAASPSVSPVDIPAPRQPPGAIGRAAAPGGVGRPPRPSPGLAGAAGAPASRGGLHRRRPGEHLAESLRAEMGHYEARRAAEPDHAPTPRQTFRPRDADAERAALNGFIDGLARAADPSEQSRDTWS
jgi:signal transduction histidine kinase